jgi:hypothetical protein
MNKSDKKVNEKVALKINLAVSFFRITIGAIKKKTKKFFHSFFWVFSSTAFGF